MNMHGFVYAEAKGRGFEWHIWVGHRATLSAGYPHTNLASAIQACIRHWIRFLPSSGFLELHTDDGALVQVTREEDGRGKQKTLRANVR